MLKEILLRGKNALVTGGGSGIGLAIAKELKDAGANIIIVGRREDALKAAVAQIGPGTKYYSFDITDFEGIPSLIQKIEAEQPIDILISNAGIQIKKPFEEVTYSEYDSIIKTHQTAAFILTQECAKYMKVRSSGSIILISSLAAILGMKYIQPYSMAKAALTSLARSLTNELGPFGIRVNTISPGFTDTEMMRSTNLKTPERHAKIKGITPLGRYATTQELGMAAAFLVSDAAAFICGVDLVVDGGISCSFSV